MTLRRLVVLSALAAIIVPAGLRAQAVRGTITDPQSGAALDGAIVVLLDEAGNSVGQVLSNNSGRFFMRAPAAGQYSLRADRIGHASTFSDSFRLAESETLVVDLRARVEAVELAGIEVDAERRCVRQPRDDGATAVVWEEARKALTAAAFTAESGAYRYQLLYRNRRLDRDARRVEAEETRTGDAFRQRSFVSRTAEYLHENGYTARDVNGDVLYYAPDAAVLLSDSFLDTHCFTVRQGRRESEGLIGLRFEPTPDRRLPDIDGTLWVDPATAELRWLDFRYRNLDSGILDDVIGGRVDFQALPSGPWIVSRWSIRMPVLQRQIISGRPDNRPTIVGVSEEGAQVVAIRDARGRPVLDFETGTIVGSVRSEFGFSGLPSARVFLVGTDHSVFADGDGRFRMTGLDAGQYLVSYEHPVTDSIGHTPEPVPVDITVGRVATVALEAPSRFTALTARCTDEDQSEGLSMLLGHVRNLATGDPLGNATVTVMWSDYTIDLADSSPSGRSGAADSGTPPSLVIVGEREQGFQMVADDAGFYLFCGVPAGHPLRVSAESGGSRSRTVQIRIDRNALYRSYDVELRVQPGTP